MNKYKHLDKIINPDAQITSILTTGIVRNCVIPNIIGQFDGRVMLWQNSDIYYPCNRIQLYYGTSLKYLYNLYKDDFDVLVVNPLIDGFNSKETIEFVEYIKNENPNKKFIFIFKPSNYAKELNLDAYKNYKDIIEKCSNDIFILKRIDHFTAELQNLKTKQTDKYECLIDDSFKDYLKKVANE